GSLARHSWPLPAARRNPRLTAQGGVYERIRQTVVAGIAQGYRAGMRGVILLRELRHMSARRDEVLCGQIVTLILVHHEEVAYRRTRLAVAARCPRREPSTYRWQQRHLRR